MPGGNGKLAQEFGKSAGIWDSRYVSTCVLQNSVQLESIRYKMVSDFCD